MASDINVQQFTNHVIYVYNQLMETFDLRNLKQYYVIGGKCAEQVDSSLTALLATNLRQLRNVASLLTI
jgi:hypothetical protein